MRKAVFDRVDEEGNIIFSLDGEPILIETPSLEDALLTSRKTKSQAGQKRLPPLPISKIQSMVRAGKDLKQVAEELHVGEDLIDRVASPIEEEKRSVIHQFLSGFYQKSPLGKERISEIVSHALTRLGIKGEEVEWNASKEGRGPWKITAEFEREGKNWESQWAWNIRDNSISSLNDEAKYLLEDDSKPMPLAPAKKLSLPPLPRMKEERAKRSRQEEEPEEAQEVETELVDPSEPQSPRIAFQSKGKIQRKGVPSWDDILFGGGVTSPRRSEES